MENHSILIVDDEYQYRKLYAQTLMDAGYYVIEASSGEEALEKIYQGGILMVISDIKMPGISGLSLLKNVQSIDNPPPFLLITAFTDIKDAVTALKIGAVDYLAKPVDLNELLCVVQETVPLKGISQKAFLEWPKCLQNLVAESAIMKQLVNDALKIAKSDATVLLTGESGTGKEVFARLLHETGLRSQFPLLAVNCASIPENLIASELFGHLKGSFTGAINNRLGVFREADQGTLFLDEIGELPLHLQSTLLRTLENRTITPVGSNKEIQVNFRLLAATNRNLEEEIEKGQFRQDLYYRLNVIRLHIPALREHPEDIPSLARHFLKGKNKRLSPSALKLIQNYNWPGNIRELANAIERACVLSPAEILLPEHLPFNLLKNKSNDLQSNSESSIKTIQQREDEAILETLKVTQGNRTKAAEILGISRRSLIYKLKRLGFSDTE